MTLRRTQRPAAVLILALLLMAAIIGSTITLSTIIGDSSRQSSTFNDFIGASLASDSNLERGLAIVKVGRINQTQANTVSKINTLGAPSGLAANSPSLDTLSWSQLLPRESVTFDISNNGLALTQGNEAISLQANRVAYTGTPTPSPIPYGQGSFDLSWVGLNSAGDVWFSGRQFLDDTSTGPGHTTLNFSSVDLFNSAYLRDTNGNTFSVGAPTPATTYGLRLRLTAFDKADTLFSPTGNDALINTTIDTLRQIQVKSVDFVTPGNAAGFPSRITITSTGTLKASQTIKSASVLWQLPSSSVFNYVIFTEGGLNPE